jgi:hypothetical protein
VGHIAASSSSEKPGHGHATVLIVDDEPGMLSLLEEVFISWANLTRSTHW